MIEMPRLDTHPTKYPLTKSPLYRLSSRRKLCELLQWTRNAKTLEAFAAKDDNYFTFTIPPQGDKGARDIQEPKEALKRLHRRLASLLLRMEQPAYLHSGRRGHSFVTNALAHVNDMPAIKLDVRKFYPSTHWDHVYRFFFKELQCSPDAAGLLATLSCYRHGGTRHIPTGSPLSQILAFSAHKGVFDQISDLAVARGGVMTLYVDDLVISMPDASPADIRRAGRILEKQGLRWHKDRFFPRAAPKRVTGTIAKADHLEADKKQHLKYHNALVALDSSITPDGSSPGTAARRALGLLQSIIQVDRRRAGPFRGMAQKLRSLAR